VDSNVHPWLRKAADSVGSHSVFLQKGSNCAGETLMEQRNPHGAEEPS
jgi:hypothetical protein